MGNDKQGLDLQDMVDELRQALQGGDSADKQELAWLLDEYGRLCQQSNARLRECCDLNERGQYANAVALSERDPNLLQLAAMLEIPERDVLATAAMCAGTRPPTLLNRDLVAMVQEAYQKDQRSSSKLRRLHTLTLSRAPLPVRLAVMRALLIDNPNHPYLDSDIRQFEKAWFASAVGFAFAYVKAGRPEVIAEMLEDLERSGYFETPPRALVASLREQMTRAQAAQIPSLAEEIRRQFLEPSLWLMKPLIEKWQALVAAAGAPADTATRLGVAPAIGWYEQTLQNEAVVEQSRQAKEQLERLLQLPDPHRLDLETAFTSAKALGALEPTLERRFHDRVAEMDRRTRNRRLAMASAVALMVIATAGIAVFAIRPSANALAIEQLLAETKPLLETGEYAAAITKIDQQPAAVMTDSAVVDLRKTAAERVAEREQIVQQAAELRKAAEQVLDGARRGRPREDEALRYLAERIAVLRKAAQRLRLPEPDLASADKALDAVDTWKKIADTLVQLDKDLKGVAADGPTLERIAQCLSDTIAPTCPEDSEWASHTRLAAQSLPHWKNALAVQKVLTEGRAVTTVLKNDWKDQPPSSPLAAAASYSEMFRQRNAKIEGTAAAKVRSYLAGSEVGDLWVIRRIGDAETRWYTQEEPLRNGQKQARVLLDTSGRAETVPFSVDDVTVHKAPQSVFARHIANLWEVDKDGNWHELLAKDYELLLKTREMETLLKLRLIRELLHLAVETSAGYRELLGPMPEFKAITAPAARIDGNWLDPGNGNKLARERAAATQLIEHPPHLAPLADAAARFDERLLDEVKRGFLLLGWITRDNDGRPRLSRFAGPEPAAGSQLYTVLDGKWIEVGTAAATNDELTAQANQYVGWPVFAVWENARKGP